MCLRGYLLEGPDPRRNGEGKLGSEGEEKKNRYKIGGEDRKDPRVPRGSRGSRGTFLTSTTFIGVVLLW